MKKNLILLAATLALMTTSVFAKTVRLDLNTQKLDQLEVENGLNAFDVYMSKTLVVERRNIKEPVETVDGHIEELYQEDISKEVVKSKVPGLIIEKSQNEKGRLELYVTFDLECLERSCAFKFTNTLGDKYALSKIPDNADYNFVTIKRKKLLGHKALFRDEQRLLPYYIESGSYVPSIVLQVSVERIKEVKKKTKKYKGAR
jgi:hypothetical protein